MEVTASQASEILRGKGGKFLGWTPVLLPENGSHSSFALVVPLLNFTFFP